MQALNPACICLTAASSQSQLYLFAEYVPEGSDSVVITQEQITGEELDVDAKVSCNAASVRSCACLLQQEPPSQHGAPWASHVTAGHLWIGALPHEVAENVTSHGVPCGNSSRCSICCATPVVQPAEQVPAQLSASELVW